MAIKYSRLISDEYSNRINTINRWARTKLPLNFLKQEILLVFIVILSSVLFIISTLLSSDIESNQSFENSHIKDINYSVIVDCGSSGTRAHIFKWSIRNNSIHNLPNIELLRDESTGKAITKHITPGLSSIHNHPDRASNYMEPIMEFVTKSIPSERHLDTPVYFMATAGLRLLDETTQKRILSDITRDLRVKFDFPRIKSFVISGEYEGLYSWLSLNFKKVFDHRFENDETPIDGTIGMIEVGGASVQVAYDLTPEVEDEILRNLKSNDALTAFRNDQITIKLADGVSVKLFAATFLGLGVNSARESSIDLMIKDYMTSTKMIDSKSVQEIKNTEIRLKDPCLTEGSSELVLRPLDVIRETKQQIGFTLKEQSDAFRVRLEGTGDFLNCFSLLERVMQLVKSARLNCPTGQRSCPMTLLGEDFIPYQHQPFAGLSEMFFTTNEMMNLAGQFNNSLVLHETKKICNTSYNVLREKYSAGGLSTHQDRILYECFKATWLLTILHSNGLKMPSQYSNFRTLDKINGREIDWTFGALVSEVFLNERQIK